MKIQSLKNQIYKIFSHTIYRNKLYHQSILLHCKVQGLRTLPLVIGQGLEPGPRPVFFGRSRARLKALKKSPNPTFWAFYLVNLKACLRPTPGIHGRVQAWTQPEPDFQNTSPVQAHIFRARPITTSHISSIKKLVRPWTNSEFNLLQWWDSFAQ